MIGTMQKPFNHDGHYGHNGNYPHIWNKPETKEKLVFSSFVSACPRR
jgi:hypothetical protein